MVFKKGNRVIHHNEPDMRFSDLVRIIFVFQKNDKRNICIHMFKSGATVLCQMVLWETTVQIVRMIPESSNKSEVCLFYDDRKKDITTEIQSCSIKTMINSSVDWRRFLGFNKDDI